MKKTIVVLTLLGSVSAFTQQLSPTVVATSGDYYVGSSTTLSWTLGEVVTDTYVGTSNQLTQGFHQPDVKFSEISDFAPEISLSAYPNPTSAEINIEIRDNEEVLGIDILDADGRTLFTGTYSGTAVKQIDFSAYADGLYLVNITSPEKGLIKTLKIQKF